MKKLIALLLALVLSLSLFACKKDEEGPKGTSPDDPTEDSGNPDYIVETEKEETSVNPIDYGLGKYITSVTYRNVVYAIYEDGAVVYECYCTKDVIEIPETVEYIIPEEKPEEEETPDGETPDGETPDGETPDGEGNPDEGVATAQAEDDECTDCEQDDAAGMTAVATVMVVGNDAFYKANASEIKLPASITAIGSNAFRNCASLKTVEFPASLTSIGDGAFAFTAFESVNIKSSITYGSKVYYGCEKLSAVTLDSDLGAIANGMFASCEAITEITLNSSLVSIGDEAFSDCYNLKNIEIPSGVTYIGAKAFNNCKTFDEIVLPNGVTAVGNYAFYGCTGAKTVSIGSSVKTIGSYAFYGCTGISEIKLPASLESFGSAAFGALEIEKISIPASVNTIPAMAFVGCDNLKSISFGGAITVIGDKAFTGTALTEFTIPTSVTLLGKYVFQNCTSLTKVDVKRSVDAISEGTFSGCTALSSVTLPSTLKTIGFFAFEGCAALEAIALPAGLTTIEGGAFRNCSTLKNVNIDKIALESLGMGAFSNCEAIESVTIPASCTAIVGSGNANTGLFDGCTSLKTVTILGNISRLGTGLFKNCTALETVVLPESVTAIGVQVFMNCTSLKNINITDNIVEFGRASFFNCPSLTEVTISKDVTVLEGYALGFLENTNVPEGLINRPLVNENFTLHGYYGTAFENYVVSYLDMNGKTVNHTALGRINGISDEIFSDYEYEIIPDAVVIGEETVIDEETGEEKTVIITADGVKIIKYKGSAEIVIVPESLHIGDLYIIEIADGAFKDNTVVRTIILPAYLKTIGNEAFAGCTSLKEFIFEETAYELPEDAEEGAIAGELTIGTDILKDSTSARVYAHKGSYVESVAKEFGWKFSTDVPKYEPVKPQPPVEPETPETPENPETPEGGEGTETPAA